MTDAARRAVLIVVVLAVIVGVGLADAGRGGGSSGGGSGATASAVMASVSADGVPSTAAESSAWFCAGGTGSGGNAQTTLVLTNPSPRAVSGTVTTVAAGAGGSAGAGISSLSVNVPGHEQTTVVPAPGVSGGALASTVVFDGGGVGVSQVVSGPLGYSAAACGSSTAGAWYFADGSTAGNDTLSLSLFNPGRTTAVVDVSFVTSTNGLLAPPAYQGIDVPGGSLVSENVGDHVRNAPEVATLVAALSGTLVAAELESAGQPGDGGTSLVLGERQATSTWSFARNMNVSGADTVFHIFNPTGQRARVTMTIGLQQGAAEPLVIEVSAMSVSTLNAADVTRIPGSTPFSATFSSGGGAGIVVSRSLSSVAGAAAPQRGEVSGVPGGSVHWLLPATNGPATGVSALAVVDLEGQPVRVDLAAVTKTGLVAVTGVGAGRVRPGTPLIVRPAAGSAIGAEPLELVSSGPVAVEMDATPAGNAGVVVIPALPVR